jgi:hypothetical protein
VEQPRSSQRVRRHIRALESGVLPHHCSSIGFFSRRLRAGAVAAIVFSASFAPIFGQSSAGQAGAIEAIGPPSDPSVSAVVVQALDAKGYRVVPGPGSAAIEIWFCKEVQAQPKSANSDAIYDRFSESTRIGVLHFTKNANDYRGQSIAAGYYALRYALMPNDANHLGVAPGRDFLLLVPIAVDPAKTPTLQELMVLSGQAAGTKHPAPLSLVSAQSDGSKPTLTRDDQGDVVFTAFVHLTSGEELPIALVVKGTAPQ